MRTKRYKTALFSAMVGAIIALFATAQARADTMTLDSQTVTEGQSGTITGIFTNTSAATETVSLSLLSETVTGDPNDTRRTFTEPTFTCDSGQTCSVSIPFTTFAPDADVDFGSTTDTWDAFTGRFMIVAQATETLTVEDVGFQTPLPAALPLFATGLGAMGLIGWRRKRKAAT